MKPSNNLVKLILLLGFYCLLFFVFNVKSYLLVFILGFIFLFFVFNYSLTNTIFILFLLSLPFENNLREWIFTVVEPIYLGIPTSGYNVYFGISLKIIFGIFLFLLTFQQTILKQKSTKTDLALLAFLILACINTLFHFSTLSLIGLLRLWLSIFFYFSAKHFFRIMPNLFPIFASVLLVFSVILGFYQLIRQKPVGMFIELTPAHSAVAGYSTTDGQSQYRLSGFISHPVYFGSFISILLPIFIIYSLNFFLPISGPLTLLAIIVTLGTFSRSTWFTLPLTIYLVYPQLKTKYQNLLSLKITKILLSIFVALTLILILSRFESVTKIFTQNGNGSIRLQLIWQSLLILAQHPLGVGLHQFTSALTELPIPDNLQGFIVPVHHTFFLIATELGIIAASLFTFFTIKSVYPVKITHPIQFSAIIGILTFFISSQFHPLLNLDPTFDLFMLTLGYINSQCPPSTT